MIGKRMGMSTIAFEQPPMLSAWAAVGGKKEQEGPLGAEFDQLFSDTMCGETTWEKAEMHLQKVAVSLAANQCGLPVSALDFMIAGDLLGQCVASSYAARGTQVPYLGVYGACSTMIEGLLLAGCMIDGGYAQRVCAAASSHFCTAERQYRFPLAYGGQRTPTAQWTATAAGAWSACSGSTCRRSACTASTARNTTSRSTRRQNPTASSTAATSTPASNPDPCNVPGR